MLSCDSDYWQLLPGFQSRLRVAGVEAVHRIRSLYADKVDTRTAHREAKGRRPTGGGGGGLNKWSF